MARIVYLPTHHQQALRTETLAEERADYATRVPHVFGPANAGYLHTIASPIQTVWFLRHRLTACDVYGGTVDVARVVRGEEDEGGGELDGLTGSAHRGLSSELGDRLTLHRSRDDRGPHRAWRDAVGPKPILHDVLGQSLGEGDDGSLGRRVG